MLYLTRRVHWEVTFLGHTCKMASSGLPPAIRIRDVRKVYPSPDGGTVTALELDALEIGQGEAVALVGPSGSGKTTLLHVLAGITPVSSGEVWIGGDAVHSLPEPARDRLRGRQIGIVFQTFNLLGAFSALENVLIAMWMAGNRRTDPRHHASDLLARVGLGDRLGHRPNQLSSGQQQRVAIARALANGPSVVLADEPTAHVDETSATAVLDLLQSECADRGATLVVSTHDPSVRARFSRVVLLSRPVVPSA